MEGDEFELLGKKRQRISEQIEDSENRPNKVLDEFENMREYKDVYLDYWVYDDRLVPVAIRIYDNRHDLVQCYVYDVAYPMQKEILKHYEGKRRRPYWIAFIGDKQEDLKNQLVGHYESYDIEWIPNEATVEFLLCGYYIRLFTIWNHSDLVEIHFSCTVTSVRYVRSEVAYRVDFFRHEKWMLLSATEVNNINQAITSVQMHIDKVRRQFPGVVDDPRWRSLARLLKD